VRTPGRLENGGVRWSLWSTTAGLRLRKSCSGERGPDVAGKERVHRRVSRAAGSKAKLTVALDGARAQRRPRNRQWSSVGGGGAPCSRGQSERGRESWAEGANERGEVGEQGAGLKRGTGARKWRRTHGRGRVHGGEIVGGRLRTAYRWGWRDRERECAGGEARLRQLWPTGHRERGRGHAQACADRRGPPVRHTGRAGASAWAGLSGPTYAEMAFSISREFLIVFLFIFSRVFNSNSNQIKYMQQFKGYLDSI
jgi:hypothetical protein